MGAHTMEYPLTKMQIVPMIPFLRATDTGSLMPRDPMAIMELPATAEDRKSRVLEDDLVS